MSALALYVVVTFLSFALLRVTVREFSAAAAIVLFLLPLTFTGRALLTGKVFGPVDLAYQAEPLRSEASTAGIREMRNPTLSDVQRLMIPWKNAVRHSLENREWPLWNSFIFAGDVLLGGSEAAPFHPANALSYLLPLDVSVTFHAAFVFFLAGVAAFLYARELGVRDAAALFAAAGWMFSSFLFFYIQVPLGAAVLMQPLVFLAARRLVRGPGSATIVLTAVILAIVVVAGHPESTLHVVSVGMVYALVELVAVKGRAAGAVILAGLGAGVLALMLSAIHLLPFIDALQQTSDFHSRKAEFAASSKSQPASEALWHALAYVVPYVHGTAGIERPAVNDRFHLHVSGYAGSILLPLALFGLWRHKGRARLVMAAAFVFGCAAGVSAPVVSDLLARLPLFDIALNDRLVYLAPLGLSILAALGVDSVSSSREQSALTVVYVTVTLIIVIITVVLWPEMRRTGLSAGFMRAGFFGQCVPLLAAIGALLTVAPRTIPAALLGLLLLQRATELDPGIPTLERRAFYPPIPILTHLPQSSEPYRTTGAGEVFQPNAGIHYELEDVRGFHGMTFAPLVRTFPLWCHPQPVDFNRIDDLSSPFLSMMNVRMAMAIEPFSVPEGWVVRAKSGRILLLENLRVLPRAFIPATLRFAPDSEQLMEMRSERDFGARVWLEGERRLMTNGRGRLLLRRKGSGYDIHAEVENETVIVVSESAWRGWRASIDGREIPTFRANIAFLALKVPAGKSSVRLRYEPRAFSIGWMSTIAGIAIAVFLIVRSRRRMLSIEVTG